MKFRAAVEDRPSMKSLTRFQTTPSTQLLTRILERPGLIEAVRELPGAVLGKLIDRIGLEDAGELVALASTAQLERIFDDDLWQAKGAGEDETFQPERFALWLRVMNEAGEAALVRRLCELPQELVALAVHRLVLVLDIDVLAEQLSPADEEAEQLDRALEWAVSEEWEEFRLLARDPDVWDDVWGALVALDRDHHDRLRAILEACCAMSTEYISGQGGLFQVLTATEMLESEVAATREDRRTAEGFISPADARAFLELARRGEGGDEPDPITRAYFRGLEAPRVDRPRERSAGGATRDRGGELAAPAEVTQLVALLREAEVIAQAPAQRFAALEPAGAEVGESDSQPRETRLGAPLFEQAMGDLRERDPEEFAARVREVGYLVNVWIAGGAHEERRPRPAEALEMVLGTCEAGLRAKLGAEPATPQRALDLLSRTPAVRLFRRGFTSRERGGGRTP
jgi:hypothetical protein